MNDFLYMESYTPEELKKAKKEMTLQEAYAVVTSHYITLNYKKELIGGRLPPDLAMVHAHILKLLDIRNLETEMGYGTNLGGELAYNNPKTSRNLRTASIIVENDLLDGKWSPYSYEFVERFASVLPRTLINYIVIRAIHHNNTGMINRIANNDIDLFMDIDGRLQKVFPELRTKAIHTGFSYANALLNNALIEIVGKKSSDFKQAAKVFDLLNSGQQSSLSLSDQLIKCFEQAQDNCRSIDEYRRNKELFFSEILKIENGFITNPLLVVGGQSVLVWTLVAKLCPMEYAMESFLDILARKDEFLNEASGKEKDYYSKVLKNAATLVLSVDADERIKAKSISSRFPKKSTTRKKEFGERYPKNTRNLEYINTIVRDGIDSAEAAKDYIGLFSINTSNDGYEVPDSSTMQKILKEYGNDSSIKRILLKNCKNINRLWDAIPYSSVPEEYTEYEKMAAAAQILTCNIDRIDEIPEDIRKKMFNSKDFITRILFPGFSYAARHEIAMNDTTISYADRGIKNGYLLIKVLMNTSKSLIDEGFLEEIRELYNYYTRYRVLKDNSINMNDINYQIDIYSFQPRPMPLASVLGIGDLSQIDLSTEFNVDDDIDEINPSQAKKSPLYSLEELEEAKKALTFDEALEILGDYYFANRSQISDYHSKQSKESNETTSIEPEEQNKSKLGIAERILGTEVTTLGMGDYLRRASIYIDNVLFNENNIGEEELEACNKFVAENGNILPKAFITAYSSLIQSKGKKQIKPRFNLELYSHLIRDCRKYSYNLTYHTYHPIDPEQLASVINNTYYDDFTRDDLVNYELIYILMAMVLYYDGESAGNTILKYMDGEDNFIPEEYTKAYNKAVDTLLKIGPDPEIYKAIFGMHDLFLYPIDSRLLGKMMEMVYGSESSISGMSSAAENKRELRNYLTDLITQSDDLFKDKMLMNIAPNEFLKWSRMDDELLLQAMMKIGRNDVEVISTLNSVVLDDDLDRIRAVNPGLSGEELSEFRGRLVSIRNKIYNPKNHKYMISLIGGEAYDSEPYPTHKQELREYFTKLVEPLDRKQFHLLMTSPDIITVLDEVIQSDYRIAGMNRQDLMNMLTEIWNQKAKQEKDLKLKKGRHRPETPTDP